MFCQVLDACIQLFCENFFFIGLLHDNLKLRVAHAPGMRGMFSPPTRGSDTDMITGVRDARAVMHVGIAITLYIDMIVGYSATVYWVY